MVRCHVTARGHGATTALGFHGKRYFHNKIHKFPRKTYIFEKNTWYNTNIKKVNSNGSDNEEDAMKWFCNHAKVAINEKIL